MRLAVKTVLFALALLLAPAAASAGDGNFVDLPPESGKSASMKVRFVKYTGGTNGHIVVDIKNGDKATRKFQAQGLYFVPNGNPDSAPQRLGAAGPFKVQQGSQWQDKEELKLKPGETRRLKLQVFCLDSHRSSPGNEQGFSVARKRLPKKLRRTIKKGADKILTKNGYKMPASKSAIQSHVWESRNEKWIKLQGERKQEKSPRKHKGSSTRQRIQQRIQSVEPLIQK